MGWSFEPDRPIYLQIASHLENSIASGQYALGERLPSVRELAAEAAVNPNTMQRALTELEARGLVTVQRTAGRFVTEDANCVSRYRANLLNELVAVFKKDLAKIGRTPEEAIALLSGNGQGEAAAAGGPAQDI